SGRRWRRHRGRPDARVRQLQDTERVPDRRTELVHGLPRPGRPGEGRRGQGLLRVPRHRRTEALAGGGLRAAAEVAPGTSDRAGREAPGQMTEPIDLRGRPNHADRVFRGLAIGAAALVLVVLAMIAL